MTLMNRIRRLFGLPLRCRHCRRPLPFYGGAQCPVNQDTACRE
jgi:hypothetical protein